MGAVPIIISVLALAISAYGVLERKEVAKRLERIRLSELLDSLNQVDLELARSNERSGISIAVLNARNELLAQQILSILARFQQETTSTEMRTLAHALAHANYWDQAELAWEWAESTARREGPVQQILALRGRAYYLFKINKATEARTKLIEAQDLNPLSSDGYRSLAATTLLDWSSYELALADRRRASELIDQAEMVLGDIELEGIRQSIRPIVDNGRTTVAGAAREAGSE